MLEPAPADTPLSVAQMVETLDVGGAEHLAIKIANALARRGHHSHLYVTGHSGPLAAAVAPGVKVRVFGFRRASILNPVRFGRSVADGLARFRAAAADDGLQVMQTHLPGPNLWGLLLQKRRTCAVIATIHNNQEFSYGSQRSLRGQLRHFAYRQIVTSCAATIAVSAEVRSSLMAELRLNDRQAARLVPVTNGIEVGPLAAASEREQLRSGLGADARTVVCLGVGRICEQKNFRALVPVSQHVRAVAGNLRFVIAGDGPDFGDLRRQVDASGQADAWRLLGSVANAPALMGAADIFVMPSLWEGLPLALLEAMAAGLPVVGSAIPGLRDVVPEGEAGYLVAPGDHEAMAARIVALAADAGLRARMGAAGRAIVARDYDLTRVVDTLEALYRRSARA